MKPFITLMLTHSFPIHFPPKYLRKYLFVFQATEAALFSCKLIVQNVTLKALRASVKLEGKTPVFLIPGQWNPQACLHPGEMNQGMFSVESFLLFISSYMLKLQ